MKKSECLICIANVTCGYRNQELFSRISLQIERGQKILITGPSGSGKTTFLKMVGGILPPYSGSLSIMGLSEQELQKKRFQLFGYHFVEEDFFSEMSTRDNILMLAKIMNIPIDENWYTELLQYFEMEKYELHRVGELSAGQQERVSIIRAFIHKPQILLLDEPGSHLDASLKKKLTKFITQYHAEHHATLFISSHGGFVDSFFDTFIEFHADYQISFR